ncbi:hypothetical protein B0H67DRAFT_587338 [Lasiosphaeris hirsuta]|uniref:2EXR domain-containing protein n=1 Tax=Lasiosphaeris hirsuta TaxID=260670 RepID=A0AA40A1H7_9PEZI|nr:hypothetical protein B0H67DRAFT_587338 [Lasiosphaeris hirsuta]
MWNGTPEDWHGFADPENPTYEECLRRHFTYVKPGKQCPHAASSLFRDPRPSPPPLRSRAAILTKVLRENTTLDARCLTLLAKYSPPDDGQGSDHVEPAPSFTQFTLLPVEIREQIWQLALPRRVLDLREVRHNRTYLGVRSAVLPVPYIAQVCREARDAVLRLGTALEIAWRRSGDASGPHSTSRAGFFIPSSDVALFMPDLECGEEPELAEGLVRADTPVGPARTLTGSTLVRAVRCSEAVVNWAGSAHQTNARSLFGNPSPQLATRLKPWSHLKDAGGALRTVYVFYRSTYLEFSLLMQPGFYESVADVDQRVEVQLLVDLYDDRRLAELVSLGVSKPDIRPRFAARDAPNPGLCLNCERVQWEQYVRPHVECQWLQLYEDELDPDTRKAVFSGVHSTYNPEHPWSREKLRDAPEFRPAVLVHMWGEEERPAFDEEWP